MWLSLRLENNTFKMHTSCLQRGYMAADAKRKKKIQFTGSRSLIGQETIACA